ncbi:MAG TPA: helix-turn-helix transcriptional regulator [Williamwhitmania sp.]|nr:helix-turn-helix transcriptional regulator [Williamwhitmania sp.]
MQDRLLKLLTGKQLTATKFAEIIGVQKSSISHILSGRNKPSFDFIEKILQKFPEINPEWLITGKGGMYRQSVQATLFDSPPKILDEVQRVVSSNTTKPPVNEVSTDVIGDNHPPMSAINKKDIERVLIFFKDKTFSEYFPE